MLGSDPGASSEGTDEPDAAVDMDSLREPHWDGHGHKRGRNAQHEAAGLHAKLTSRRRGQKAVSVACSPIRHTTQHAPLVSSMCKHPLPLPFLVFVLPPSRAQVAVQASLVGALARKLSMGGTQPQPRDTSTCAL